MNRVIAVLLLAAAGIVVAVDRGWTERLPIPIVHNVDYPGAWILLVENAGESPANVVVLKQDAEFWAGFEGRKLNKSFLEYGDNEDVRPYKAKADEIGIPCLLAIAADGTYLGGLKLGDDANKAAADSWIKEKTGR